MDEIVVSSTSTCAERYKQVVREMRELKRLGGRCVHPLLWLTPRMLRTWGLKYMLRSGVEWEGVKMHWGAQREWFYNRRLRRVALDLVEQWQVPLVLHTGEGRECHAAVFEELVRERSSLTFILAHGRPLDESIALLERYENVWLDCAFMPRDDLQRLARLGLGGRVRFGTDAPINEVFFENLPTQDYIRRCFAQFAEVIGGRQ